MARTASALSLFMRPSTEYMGWASRIAYEPVKFGGLQEEWLLVYLVNMLHGQRLYVSSGPASKSVECRRAAKSATDI